MPTWTTPTWWRVTATSGTSPRTLTAVQAITVTVTDVNEPPSAPSAPTISSVTATGFTVSWTAPTNTGPAITGYAVQYREGTSGPWTNAGHSGTDPSIAVTGLTAGTAHQVQVQATNAEGTSAWSASASATTVANEAPTFSSGDAFNVAENATAVGTVTATDADASDSVTGYAVTGGADRSKFSIDANSGALTFTITPNYEAPADADMDNAYLVEVTATSGTSARELTAVQAITVTVTDVNEPPSAPSAPTISSVTAGGFTVSWTAPANTGPAITGYAVQYREGTGGTWTDAGHVGTGLSVAVTGLTAGTAHQVQVQATNAEGTSAWSASATATTVANEAPTFSSGDAFSVAENAAAVGTVTATDDDASDSVTGYAVTGGADRSKFSIDANSGALTFTITPNYEAPADADMDNAYLVEGDGDERDEPPHADGGAGDHGDGDGCERTPVGPVGADDLERDGDGVHGDVDGADEHGTGDHWLRRAVPGGDERAVDQRGPQRHGSEHRGDGPDGGDGPPGAGAGDERRRHERVVGFGDRHDGGERGADVQQRGCLQRGGERDGGGHGDGDGRRRERQRHRLRGHRRRGPEQVLDRRQQRCPDVHDHAELRGSGGCRHGQRLPGGG